MPAGRGGEELRLQPHVARGYANRTPLADTLVRVPRGEPGYGRFVSCEVAEVLTERLELRPVTCEDVEALFAVTSDPATWRQEPGGRHRDRGTTANWISRAFARWNSDGLSYWLVRVRAGQQVIGVGGVQRQHTGNWNLYYRFTPSVWGRGYATELGQAALAAAHDVDDSVPVIAWMLPQNAASINVARRLSLIDHGPHTDPSDGQLRLAFADRPTAALR